VSRQQTDKAAKWRQNGTNCETVSQWDLR